MSILANSRDRLPEEFSEGLGTLAVWLQPSALAKSKLVMNSKKGQKPKAEGQRPKTKGPCRRLTIPPFPRLPNPKLLSKITYACLNNPLNKQQKLE